MRRMTPRLATAALIAPLILLAWSAPRSEAASVLSYEYGTTGDIAGTTGGQPVVFNGMPSTSNLTTPGSFLLGTFQVNPLPSTESRSYDHTPFTIGLVVQSLPNTGANYPFGEVAYDYTIKGELNGAISSSYGLYGSGLIATVTSISAAPNDILGTPPFPVSDLRIGVPQGIAAVGDSLLTAQIGVTGFPLPTPAPEPTSIAAFAAALAGWALGKKARARG